jgi:hypothetical protein
MRINQTKDAKTPFAGFILEVMSPLNLPASLYIHDKHRNAVS